MKIYLDLVLLLNFTFDFLLLMSVSLLLRRNVKIVRIFFLFIKITSLQLFLLKLMVSILMVIITFNYRDLKYTLRNLLYLYMASIVLGGFLYFLNIEFSYKNNGLVFYHNGLSINFVFLIIFSPIILYIYIRQGIKLKNNYSNYYQVDICLNGKIIKCNGYLDTGNNLVDPIKKRPIILVNKNKIKINDNYILVPYQSSSNHSVLKCIKVDYINIKKLGIKKNVLVGIMEDKINIDGIDCLLNNKLLEG